MQVTFAVCTYNRAQRLARLVAAMRQQVCSAPFEILVVNNNLTDHTVAELVRLQKLPGPPLRWVTEPHQGIVAARNRAIAEALDRDVLVFIDDDELPMPGLLEGAIDAIRGERADCAGGRVEVDFPMGARPRWLGDDLLGFLGALDYGQRAFWITNGRTPVWAGNIAYATRLFRTYSHLRFDERFDRKGKDVGGGEDAAMFRDLLALGARIRYRPDMAVLHAVEPWRLTRRYFLRLHYRSGLRSGRYRLPSYDRTLLGAPAFLYGQLARQSLAALSMLAQRKNGWLRQAMNAAHALGMVVGYRERTERGA